MNKILKMLILTISIIAMITLTGCTSNEVAEDTNPLSVSACMQEAGVNKSEYGKNLTYYYKGPDDIALYYVKNWNNGEVTLRRYFATEEQYNVQKNLYPDAKTNDNKLFFTLNKYMEVEDMDAFWNEIENSTTYTIVK